MKSELRLLAAAMVMLGLSTSALVVLPYLQVHDTPPTPGLQPYTSAELRGRQVYIANGCVYCHSQQPRAKSLGPDAARGWGRASVAGDYAYDAPHLLGTMRTGPDLLNIGLRQPDAGWHLGHLYQPRAYVPGSIMPSYPFLFEAKPRAEAGDVVVNLPPGQAPAGQVVVARPEAQDLVKYLQSLQRGQPVVTAQAAVRGAQAAVAPAATTQPTGAAR